MIYEIKGFLIIGYLCYMGNTTKETQTRMLTKVESTKFLLLEKLSETPETSPCRGEEMDFLKDTLIVYGRIVTILPLLLFTALFMGKRSIGELPVFDF